jgi:hypothetical protein
VARISESSTGGVTLGRGDRRVPEQHLDGRAGCGEDAIARRIEMTVWRNGALVDVFVVPRELAEP